jgi:uncharacterized OB-fold protein
VTGGGSNSSSSGMVESQLLPAIDAVSAPFWDAAGQHELRMQSCVECGRLRFPPRPMCARCRSTDSEWRLMSGRGRVWSFVVPHPPLLPAFMPLAPYNVVVVELVEEPTLRMVGNLVLSPGGPINEVDPSTIGIGMPVRVVFERLTDDVTLPRWMPEA